MTKNLIMYSNLFLGTHMTLNINYILNLFMYNILIYFYRYSHLNAMNPNCLIILKRKIFNVGAIKDLKL